VDSSKHRSTQLPTLMWPDGWPPSAGWRRYLRGVPLIGPDLSFFATLDQIQASRTPRNMELWGPNHERRNLAACLGVILADYLGWKRPYFLPDDRFEVVTYGPKYRDLDELLFEEATLEFEKTCGRRLPDSDWMGWSSATFGEVIDALLARGFKVPDGRLPPDFLST